MELWCRQMKCDSVPWNSISNGRDFKRAPFQMTQVFHGIPWNVPWNSMELWCRQMKYHLVPWNSMELWDCHFIQYHVTLDFYGKSMEFHANLESPNKNITEFLVIPWNSDIWQSLSLRDWRWKSVVTLRWMGATFSGSGLAPTEYRQRHPVCTGYHAVNDNDI